MWSAVEFGGHHLQLLRSVGRVNVPEEMLSQQAVGVLLRAAPPGASRIAEVDRISVELVHSWWPPSPRPGHRAGNAEARRKSWTVAAKALRVARKPWPRSRWRVGSCRRPIRPQIGDPHSSRPPRLMRPPAPLKVRGARYRSDLNAWQQNESSVAKAATSETWRSDVERRTANTSSCVLRACCLVATSLPLRALTLRPPESGHGTDHRTSHAPHRTGPWSDRGGGSSATLPSANCTTRECSVPAGCAELGT